MNIMIIYDKTHCKFDRTETFNIFFCFCNEKTPIGGYCSNFLCCNFAPIIFLLIFLLFDNDKFYTFAQKNS